MSLAETADAAATAPVLTRLDDHVGRLTLNRPRALHALNLEMCREMTAALLAWREDLTVRGVILDHAGERGFCAGGDIRRLAEAGASAAEEARDFFGTEYRLNHLLFTYPKPIVAVIDGVVMGGGVGISMPCRWRVATERTLFAMPETSIGLFPDVGGGWHLSRLPGETGTWLALTGARLKAADCLALGIANAFVPSEQVEALKHALLERLSRAAPAEAASVAGAVMAEFSRDPGSPPLQAVREAIDRLFAADSVEAILEGLERDGSDWALAQLELLRTKSPQSLKVSLRQVRTGRNLASFEDDLAMEYRLATRVALEPDFREGVRSVLIDKDNTPRWNPSTLAAVTEDHLERLFSRLPADLEWTPLP